MITSGFGTEVYEVKLAILEPQAGDTTNLKRYFSTSEQLIDYLKNRPMHHFYLRAIHLGSPLTHDTDVRAYRPEFGDVRCGYVFYDTKDHVVYSPLEERLWGG